MLMEVTLGGPLDSFRMELAARGTNQEIRGLEMLVPPLDI